MERVKLSKNKEKNISLCGYLNLFRNQGSIIGLKTLKIGASQETDTGVILFLFGLPKIWKK